VKGEESKKLTVSSEGAGRHRGMTTCFFPSLSCVSEWPPGAVRGICEVSGASTMPELVILGAAEHLE
jgi:hypothetical protein